MIEITQITTSEDGGCNACPARPEKLWRIRIGKVMTFSVRLCGKCMTTLRQEIQKVNVNIVIQRAKGKKNG